MHAMISVASGGVARTILRGLGIVTALLLLAGVGLWLGARRGMGGRVLGERLARAQRSPEWRDSAFRNRRPRIDGAMGMAMTEFMFGGSKYRKPAAPVPVLLRTAADYQVPPASGLRVTWLGHSTTLLEIDGQRVLLDPVWSDRASPLPPLGGKAFFSLPLPLDQLPALDAVLISHDHFDHLDMRTVKALAARGARFLVPLGVGAHMEAWGVPPDRVRELDWWDAAPVGGLTLTATPARHFSGRTLSGRDRTLWAGWSIVGPRHRVYYSGDSALDDTMIEIGARLGPFDLTLIDAGAYDARWADVHLGPEQAVRAHRLVRGNLMLPVHWARFDLALHGWTEPVERVLAAATVEGVRVATPRPGESLEPDSLRAPVRWWPALPWRTALQAPIRSSGVDHLMAPLAPALPAGSEEGREQP